MKRLLYKFFSIFIVFCLLSGFFIVYPYFRSIEHGIPILGYHGIVSVKDKNTKYKDYIYAIDVVSFKKQMKYLYDHHYHAISLDDFYNWYKYGIQLPTKSIVLTFDDGFSNMNDIVKPILKQYGFHGTNFVIGKHITHPKNGFLTKHDIKNDTIVSYYSHTYDLHQKGTSFDKKRIEEYSLKMIDNDFKRNPVDSKYLAYPYGRSRNDIDHILSHNHVKLAFTYNDYKHASRSDDCFKIPRYMVVSSTPFNLYKLMIKK